MQSENEFLQREVDKLDKEACINNDEAETRRREDKEIKAHIESLYNELEKKTNALIAARKKHEELRYYYRKLHGPRSMNEKSHACLVKYHKYFGKHKCDF